MRPDESLPSRFSPPRGVVYLLIFGLYLTLRGYHSRDGDQAYRLPLLLHRQDPALFANDPFVRAFDTFNPHRGSLVLLDLASRPLGLSAGLFGLFALTFAATCLGIDRLARAIWPELGPRIGLVAIGLVLTAKAGNIGTNHLFEAMLLDRLMAFALGWLALAEAIERPERGWWLAPVGIGLAALIHPSVGIQLALVLGGSWLVWALCAQAAVTWKVAAGGCVALGLALLPGVALNLGQGGRLLNGLPPDAFRLLAVELQGPQHMLPHLWRVPQWLAWGCYFVAAGLALWSPRRAGFHLSSPSNDGRLKPARPQNPIVPARLRLALLLIVNLMGLGLAWCAVEWLQNLRITLFQPFRSATVARGLALVIVSGRVRTLWTNGRALDRVRAALVAVGLVGDWAFVVATSIDAGIAGFEALISRYYPRGVRPEVVWVLAGGLLGTGFWFLHRHDTEAGHVPLVLATLGALMVGILGRIKWPAWNRRRVAWVLLATWLVPAASLALTLIPHRGAWMSALRARCRFGAEPVDDIERLAVWCRDHTPTSARFIGPPGPKTFRLWSLRSLAFNRAASPYHAEGLADWFGRFREHVDHEGSSNDFVRAYQTDRHGLERRYEKLSPADRAALALRQGATHVVAPPAPRESAGPLELLHVEGRYAVYRVRADPVIARLKP